MESFEDARFSGDGCGKGKWVCNILGWAEFRSLPV